MFKDRFMKKVSIDYNTECWNWTAGKSKGYGRFYYGGTEMLAHRYAWLKLVGFLPEWDTSNGKNSLLLNHLCRNRSCVNVEHLEITTIEKNVLTGVGPSAVHKSKTCCPRCGREYYYQNSGKRRCKFCSADYAYTRYNTDEDYREYQLKYARDNKDRRNAKRKEWRARRRLLGLPAY